MTKMYLIFMTDTTLQKVLFIFSTDNLYFLVFYLDCPFLAGYPYLVLYNLRFMDLT